MWADAESCFATLRRELEAEGVTLRARVEVCEGLMCGYREGVVRLTLPELTTPEGSLRATMLGAMMGLGATEVAWLFHALLPRLVAHEIGHALRDEAGLLGTDLRAEEQIADRVATHFARTMIPERDRGRAKEMLGEVSSRLGGVPEAIALHRDAGSARRRFGLDATAQERERALAVLQRDYYRDVGAYLRLTVAWAWIDLTLDTQEDFDAIRRDCLAA